MVKRDIRYIIKRILIGVAIAFIIAFMKSEGVWALTINQSAYFVYTQTSSPGVCTSLTGSGITSFGTHYNVSASNGQSINICAVAARLRFSEQATSGNEYTISFIHSYDPLSPLLNNNAYLSAQYQFTPYLNNSYDNEVMESFCQTSRVQNNNYQLKTTCRFKPYQNIPANTFFRVYINYTTSGGATPAFNLCLSSTCNQGFNMSSPTVATLSENAAGAINYQTGVIQSLMNNAIDAISTQTGIDRQQLTVLTDIATKVQNGANSLQSAIQNASLSNINNWEELLNYIQDGGTSGINTSGITGGGQDDYGTGISGLVLMPGNMLTSIINSADTCTGYSLGSLYGHELRFPCIDPVDYLGSTLWNLIDILISGVIIYNISKRFIKIFENFTNFRDSLASDLYGGGL